jgi:hypothetical protein
MNIRELVSMNDPLFDLGIVTKTWEVNQFLKDNELNELLTRHQYGDWSEMAEEDQLSNLKATGRELRIFSSYTVRDKKVWVITEADRSSTTVLFPHEY